MEAKIYLPVQNTSQGLRLLYTVPGWTASYGDENGIIDQSPPAFESYMHLVESVGIFKHPIAIDCRPHRINLAIHARVGISLLIIDVRVACQNSAKHTEPLASVVADADDDGVSLNSKN